MRSLEAQKYIQPDFGSVRMVTSASRKKSFIAGEAVKKENRRYFLDRNVCSSEFKRFWQVWV